MSKFFSFFLLTLISGFGFGVFGVSGYGVFNVSSFGIFRVSGFGVLGFGVSAFVSLSTFIKSSLDLFS